MMWALSVGARIMRAFLWFGLGLIFVRFSYAEPPPGTVEQTRSCVTDAEWEMRNEPGGSQGHRIWRDVYQSDGVWRRSEISWVPGLVAKTVTKPPSGSWAIQAPGVIIRTGQQTIAGIKLPDTLVEMPDCAELREGTLVFSAITSGSAVQEADKSLKVGNSVETRFDLREYQDSGPDPKIQLTLDKIQFLEDIINSRLSTSFESRSSEEQALLLARLKELKAELEVLQQEISSGSKGESGE